jgi:hypothetical protein
MSAADSPRAIFHQHPWSIGGGGAAELKELIDDAATRSLGDLIDEVGRTTHTGDDEAFVLDLASALRKGIGEFAVTYVEGEDVRDYLVSALSTCVFPYDRATGTGLGQLLPKLSQHFWPIRTGLKNRRDFGQFIEERGLAWWDHSMFFPRRFLRPTGIGFAFVATHNHFVLDRGGKVFKQSAPVIILKPDATEADHRALLGILNSSTACFWMQQVFHNKGRPGAESTGANEPFEHRFEFDSTKLKYLPIPACQPSQLPTALVQTSETQQTLTPAATLQSWGGPGSGGLHECLLRARNDWHHHRRQMIAGQEELDWQMYESYGLLETASESGAASVSLPEGAAVSAIPPEGLGLGQRAFEVVLARRMAAGEVHTKWFERHGSTPITELPLHWPAEYRELVERRLARIADDPAIRLIEQPAYKRRWNTEPWDEQFANAARDWLLAWLETYFFDSERMDGSAATAAQRQSWPAGQEPKIFSLAQLVAVAETDAALKEVMQEYTGTPTFDLTRQIRELLEEGSVPYLPVLRYKESGLRKRQAWEETWVLQRREDAIEADVRAQNPGSSEDALKPLIREAQKKEVGEIPVPPKYASVDFKKAGWWKLRGKLDVPKERWVSYPKLESDAAPSPLYSWAGWTHLQQVQALAELYVERKDRDGWDAARLTPILAGLQELVPWLQQWHNEEDPTYGLKLGDYFADYVNEERRTLGLTLEILEEARLGV